MTNDQIDRPQNGDEIPVAKLVRPASKTLAMYDS